MWKVRPGGAGEARSLKRFSQLKTCFQGWKVANNVCNAPGSRHSAPFACVKTRQPCGGRNVTSPRATSTSHALHHGVRKPLCTPVGSNHGPPGSDAAAIARSATAGAVRRFAAVGRSEQLFSSRPPNGPWRRAVVREEAACCDARCATTRCARARRNIAGTSQTRSRSCSDASGRLA
jgi:hypothetical protein